MDSEFQVGFQSHEESTETGEYGCVGEAKLRVTMWLEKINDEASKLKIVGKLLMSAECVDLDCGGFLGELIDGFNDSNKPEDAEMTGDGTRTSPMVVTFRRQKLLGCCADKNCPITRKVTDMASADNDIYGPLPSTEEQKQLCKEIALAEFWFGGTGSSIHNPIDWSMGPTKCCPQPPKNISTGAITPRTITSLR